LHGYVPRLRNCALVLQREYAACVACALIIGLSR
jgi:hypothetical protein